MADPIREAMTACNCAAAQALQTPRTQPERRRAGDSTAAGAAETGKTPRRRRRSDAFAAVRHSPLGGS